MVEALTRTLSDQPYVDFNSGPLSISTTLSTVQLFTAIQTVLAAYPQHATPTSFNVGGATANRLRTRIIIQHLDVDYKWVGSEGSLIANGDLYNIGRMAWYREGQKFNGFGGYTPGTYLTGVTNGTTIDDCKQVYVDRQISLSTQAFDTASNFNVPQVKVGQFRINVNRTFTFYSEVAAGNTTWQTAEGNLCVDAISDSTVAPNPIFQHNTRIWFQFG